MKEDVSVSVDKGEVHIVSKVRETSVADKVGSELCRGLAGKEMNDLIESRSVKLSKDKDIVLSILDGVEYEIFFRLCDNTKVILRDWNLPSLLDSMSKYDAQIQKYNETIEFVLEAYARNKFGI